MTQTFQSNPDLLAKGLGTADFPVPRTLLAGDAPTPTDRGTTGAAIAAYQLLGRNASGDLVPWAPFAAGLVGDANATGVLTYATGVPTAADTVTINGHAITAIAHGVSPTAGQYDQGTSIGTAGDNIAAVINGNPTFYGVTAASNGAGVVTLVAVAPGTASNAITTTESGTHTSFGGATLSGGTDKNAPLAEAALVGVACVPAANNDDLPFYRGGIFNWEAVGKPAGITTLAQLQALTDASPLSFGRIL